MGTNGIQYPLLVRELAGFELGINLVTVEADLKASPIRWDELQLTNLLLVNSQELARQTDGLRFVISSSTVSQFQFHRFSFYLGFPHSPEAVG